MSIVVRPMCSFAAWCMQHEHGAGRVISWDLEAQICVKSATCTMRDTGTSVFCVLFLLFPQLDRGPSAGKFVVGIFPFAEMTIFDFPLLVLKGIYHYWICF